MTITQLTPMRYTPPQPDRVHGIIELLPTFIELAAPETATATRRAPAGRIRTRPAAPEIAAVATPDRTQLADATAAVDTTEATETTATEEEPDVAGDIPGADQPTWGAAAPPPPATEHDPTIARRIHATITELFPDDDPNTRDRWRHALVAVITRKRPDGPVTSSAEIDLGEQLLLSDLLARIKAGQATVADGPDDTVEIRGGGGWRYTVAFDPLTVTVRQGDIDPDHQLNLGGETP